MKFLKGGILLQLNCSVCSTAEELLWGDGTGRPGVKWVVLTTSFPGYSYVIRCDADHEAE